MRFAPENVVNIEIVYGDSLSFDLDFGGHDIAGSKFSGAIRWRTGALPMIVRAHEDRVSFFVSADSLKKIPPTAKKTWSATMTTGNHVTTFAWGDFNFIWEK